MTAAAARGRRGRAWTPAWLLLTTALGCAAGAGGAPHEPAFVATVATGTAAEAAAPPGASSSVVPPPAAPSSPEPTPAAPPNVTTAGAPRDPAPSPAAIALTSDVALPLAPGTTRLVLELPATRLVTVGIVGLRSGLERLAFDAPYAELAAGTPEDGALPVFAALETSATPAPLAVEVALSAPGWLVARARDPLDLTAPTPRELKRGLAAPRPLVALPQPSDPGDGYVLLAPHRYEFARVDVAVALRQALRQTRTRFRRGPLGVRDLSQWDADRPATDAGEPRHIGHTGGREVDVGLPSSDESPSVLTTRCQAVIVDKDVLKCAPGTVRGFDALRLAYFLGLLLDGPTPDGRYMPENRPGPVAPLESILTDQVYVDAVRKALPELRKRFWIHDDAYGALMEEGVLRASPWHVDHVHLRFGGEDGARIEVPRPREATALHVGQPWAPSLGP